MKKAPNRQDMLFLDARRDVFWRRVRDQLMPWARDGLDVLDVACGYGQFASVFTPRTYLGVDFSDEMLKIAEEEAKMYRFLQSDAHSFIPPQQFDVIFEVNSLKSLGMSAEEFIAKFKPYAKRAVATLEADRFTVENVY